MAAITAAVIGAGAAIYGTVKQNKAAKQQAAAQQQQIQAEQQAEALRRQQMELEARRRQREIIRNQQKARAMALATSTNQGAALGSGLQGGYGQIAGDAGTQQLNTAQNLMIGRGIFDANVGVSNAKMAYASASSDMATGRTISSLGGTIMSLGPTLKNIGGGYFPQSSGPWVNGIPSGRGLGGYGGSY